MENNHPIICSVGPGDFTDAGHFIVIVGYDENGYIVNDPNSPAKSSREWSFDQLSSQIKVMWEYSKKGE